MYPDIFMPIEPGLYLYRADGTVEDHTPRHFRPARQVAVSEPPTPAPAAPRPAARRRRRRPNRGAARGTS